MLWRASRGRRPLRNTGGRDWQADPLRMGATEHGVCARGCRVAHVRRREAGRVGDEGTTEERLFLCV